MEPTIKKLSKRKLLEITEFIKYKQLIFYEIIQRTMLSVSQLKIMDIISSSNLAICNESLELLFSKLQTIDVNITNNNYSEHLSLLQIINNDISTLFNKYGSQNMGDLLTICLDKNYIQNNVSVDNEDMVEILMKLFQPVSYKTIMWSHIPNNIDETTPLLEDFSLAKHATNFECFPLNNSTNFKLECSGIKVVIHYPQQKKSIIVSGIISEISLQCINNNYISYKIKNLTDVCDDIDEELLKRFILSLTIKDLLIYTAQELKNIIYANISSLKMLKSKSIMSMVKQFTKNTILEKRNTIIQLLLFQNESDFQYIAYLLYDLLTTDVNNMIDSSEQVIIYNSLPNAYKKYFKDAMSNTLSYTEKLYNFTSNIPLEQQICLLKVKETVKEKAMQKLKEVKSKSDDTGSKARQYLEGLLRIPFGQYTNEEIMEYIPTIVADYNKIITNLPEIFKDDFKHVSTYIEVQINLDKLLTIIPKCNDYYYQLCKNTFTEGNKSKLIKNINSLNQFFKMNVHGHKKISHTGKTIDIIREDISTCITQLKADESIWKLFLNYIQCDSYKYPDYIKSSIQSITTNIELVQKYMGFIDDTLNKSVYGHDKAKQQIKRIIGQWISGENTGYCFGFEGPPGVGKTSLAKEGIAQCLKANNGNTRPFSFIAVGGSSNGSTFEGHNYTYVGSTWGKIVDVLMDSKCMNPIIFIDELDKISKTENGKELIGILTHLIDSSQNDKFQDKYFNGVDVDVSKILFIFSYNDVSMIDRILLDRIHRVQFDRLTIIDKIEVTQQHLLREVSSKLGMIDQVSMDDDTVRFLVNRFTNESGVRKLKEILFEIYAQINLEILEQSFEVGSLPIILTKDNIENKYLKDRFKSKPQLIHKKPTTGLISGLWANTLGMGGILSIESSFIVTTNFLDLKLTGMQGDVMKESMNVAKTLAWNLLTKSQQEKMRVTMEETKQQGIHIHCPDGATNKDGPSAGTAITIVMYSLLTHKKIKNNIAITGEINLQGNVTPIGGLDLKIIGGIEAGVTEFIFPLDNEEDFDKFLVKYEKRKEILEGITFHKVSTIQEVMKLVFIKP
jgi:ATP-dependent Lon protease